MRYLLLTLLLIQTGYADEQPSEISSHLILQNGGLSFEKDSREPVTGVSIKYHANGQVEVKRTFIAGREISKIVFDYHGNGQLKKMQTYKDGILNGLAESYNQRGFLKSKGNYKDRKADGLWEWYHENGQLSSKGNYKNGKNVGLYESYYENSQLRFRETYKDGNRYGLRRDYNENGKEEPESPKCYQNNKEVDLSICKQ